MAATRPAIRRKATCLRGLAAHGGSLLALWLTVGLVPQADAQYMYVDTNGNGVRDGGDLLNAGCPTQLAIWLDTNSNRDGSTVACNTGVGTPTLNSYMFALRVAGGTVSWSGFQNDQTDMPRPLAADSTSTEYVRGFGGTTSLPPGTYRLATLAVTPLAGAPILYFVGESSLGSGLGTNFGSGCPGLVCDHTYKLDTDWFDTEGIGPPTDAAPPSINAPAYAGAEEGASVTFSVTVSDCEPIDYIQADLSALPGGNATFVGSGDHRSGTVTWTPGPTDEGFYTVTFVAGNGRTATATTLIQVINRTDLVPYRADGYRFIQLIPGLPFPPGIESPSWDETGYPILPGPFGDTMCPGILPATYWITSTPMVVRRWFSPGSEVAGAKLRFLIDNNATIFLNGTEVASVHHGGCPAPDDFLVPLASSLILPDSNLVVALCTDEQGWSSFDLSITALDVGPVVAAPAAVTILSGQELSVGVTASDPEGSAIASLTADLANLPAGNDAAFTSSPDHTTGALTWTPAPGDVRVEPYPISIAAGNALTGSRTIQVTVTATDTPPVVTAPPSISLNHGTPILFSITAVDPESQPLDSLTADLSDLPPGNGATFTTSAASDSGFFAWTPDVADVTPDPYAVTFTAWNNLSGAAQTEILVTNDDRAPVVAAPATAPAGENSLLSLGVTASDPDGDAIALLAPDFAALPPGHDAQFVAAPDNSSGTLTWTPTFADGRVPPYPVTFTASNALSGSATTQITVQNVDRAPSIAAPAAVSGPPADPIAFAVTAGDPDGNAIDSLVARSMPPGATFSPSPDYTSGAFSWTPGAGDLCTRRGVTFIAANFLADSATTEITVSTGDCAPVVSAPAALAVLAGAVVEIDVSALDPDGGAISTLTADLSGLPSGNNAIFGITSPDRSTGHFAWTPTAYVEGTYPVTFTASNALSGSATTQISVTPTAGYTTSRVSVSSTGAEGNASSYSGRISADGRYVAFHSNASNLVPGDTNLQPDVFRRDLVSDATERVSLTSIGGQASGPCVDAYISADGRYVAFTSTASNLVPDDSNGAQDVFVRDIQAGTTERVSLGDTGQESNGPNFASGISGDGRYVAFCSDGSNLVPDDTNDATDVFVRDRVSATTLLLSRSSDGTLGNARSCENSAGAISADGRFVAFPSIASNLVSDDANGRNDVFVRDLVDGTTEIVSRSSLEEPSGGLSAWPAISADGRYVAFSSFGPNLVSNDFNGTWDVFVRDRTLGVTDRVTLDSSEVEANANSGYPGVSAAGTEVAFLSYASNLVPGDGNGIADIFLRDQAQGATERVSVSGTSQQATGPNAEVGIVTVSADGRFVVFCMAAPNLVPGDGNNAIDVFVRDRQQNASSVAQEPTVPRRRALLAHPNPSRRGVTIRFYAASLPTTPLRIYDVQGRLVRELAAPPGAVMPIQYAWDGIDDRGRAVAAGVYFAVAVDGSERIARKVVIVE